MTIVCLALGSALVPSGVVAKSFIGDLVAANLHTGLLGIQEEAGPIVENMVNLTFGGMLMYLAYFYLTIGETGGNEEAAREKFFNEIDDTANITYAEAGVVEIECLSYYFGENQSFTPLAQNRTFFGNGIKGEADYLPGLVNDSRKGEKAAWDAIDFFELYDAAVSDSAKKTKMCGDYDCSWNQLEKLNTYVRTYVFYEKIPQILGAAAADPGHPFWGIKPELAGLGVQTTKDIADYYFLAQWANGSLVADPGFPLPLGFMEAYGLEVGIPNPSNITLQTAKNLWNATLEYSMTKPIGMDRWKAAMANPDSSIASYLQSVHGLTAVQMAMLLDWLHDFQYDLMPYLAQYLYGLPADTATLADLLQNGGILIGIVLILLAGIGMYKIGRNKAKSKEPPSRWKQISDAAFLGGLKEKNGARLA